MVTTPVEIDAAGQLDPKMGERAGVRHHVSESKVWIPQEYET